MLNTFFGLRGSVDRLPYFLGVTACQIVLAGALAVLLGMARPGFDPIWLWAFGAVGLLCAWISFALTWKRLHDFEIHGLWALLMFVPVVGVGMYLLFSVLKGDIADPPYRVSEHQGGGPD